MKSPILVLGLAVGAASLLSACAGHHHETERHTHFVPGLGEIMAQTATRHTKLWFAGQAKNWDLAAYEVDELKEGMEDAGKYHPTHKHITRPIPDLLGQHMDQPLAALERAIKERNPSAFAEHYDHLTAACNGCHQATDFGFNIVTRPTMNPFPNQLFGTSK